MENKHLDVAIPFFGKICLFLMSKILRIYNVLLWFLLLCGSNPLVLLISLLQDHEWPPPLHFSFPGTNREDFVSLPSQVWYLHGFLITLA